MGLMPALALFGGKPIRQGGWPCWPQVGPRVAARLEEVLASGRWTISAPYLGHPSFEQRFAAAFAGFCGTRYCVPTASGTASLMVALEACGVGAGDEVIIPGLTWVASASAVLGVNAVPILADIDPDTLCLDPRAVEAAISSRTRAICAVHLFSALAELSQLTAIARRHGLALIEDCSQAHGAAYAGKRVGGLGAIGAFSMQHNKLLTSGEGGAVVTNDEDLARQAAQLRADGRLFRPKPLEGQLELVPVGEPMGSNRCLSEFQAAVLLESLPDLTRLNGRRAENAGELDSVLVSSGAYHPQQTSQATTIRTYYKYAFALDPETFEDIPVRKVADALGAELGVIVERTYPPLNDNVLYQPASRRRFQLNDEHLKRIDPSRFALPECRKAHERFLTLHHRLLLGGPDELRALQYALIKLVEHREELRAVAAAR